MLFDLRGAGRRRTVKTVYLGLALLMFVGFVGFSIGSSGLGGGLLDVFTQNGGGGGSSGTGRFQTQVRQAQAQTRTHPDDPAAWAALAGARVRLAGVGDNFDTAKSDYTAKGRTVLQGAASAWNQYLNLNPKHPDERLARQMLQAFVALNQPAGAVTAQDIVTRTDPTSSTFAQLAVYAYQAGQTRKGDLASAKAVSLAPKGQRKTLKSQLAAAKSQAAASSTGSGSSNGSSGGSTGGG
jgi:hypothetical protein